MLESVVLPYEHLECISCILAVHFERAFMQCADLIIG